tara:strand:- start:11804 stop:12487 length:684 start_codon:yes stop_codon:yes gene_type:complete
MMALLLATSFLLIGDIQTTPPEAPREAPRDIQFPFTVRTMPSWIFETPGGDNALTTVTSIQGRELTRQVQYLARFSPGVSKYDRRTAEMMVARTQDDFDRILKLIGDIKAPRKLDFDKELFVFVFAGTKDANDRTLVEVAEVDRNNGPITKQDFVFDSCLVRVHIDHLGGEAIKGYSPWTMIRVDKETFFKEHPMTGDTKFVMIEARSYVRTTDEKPLENARSNDGD